MANPTIATPFARLKDDQLRNLPVWVFVVCVITFAVISIFRSSQPNSQGLVPSVN